MVPPAQGGDGRPEDRDDGRNQDGDVRRVINQPGEFPSDILVDNIDVSRANGVQNSESGRGDNAIATRSIVQNNGSLQGCGSDLRNLGENGVSGNDSRPSVTSSNGQAVPRNSPGGAHTSLSLGGNLSRIGDCASTSLGGSNLFPVTNGLGTSSNGLSSCSTKILATRL